MWNDLQNLWSEESLLSADPEGTDKKIHENFVVRVSELTCGCEITNQGTFLYVDSQNKLDEIRVASRELVNARIKFIQNLNTAERKNLNFTYETAYGRWEDRIENQCKEYFVNRAAENGRRRFFEVDCELDYYDSYKCPYCGEEENKFAWEKKELDCCEDSLSPIFLRKQVRIKRKRTR